MKILIAEDDATSSKVLSQIFATRTSWEVTVVENGASAWWLLTDPDAESFDLLITDLDMPLLGGLDLVKRVRKTRHLNNMLVVVCSVNKERDIVTELVRNGTNGYILKPFEAKEVLAKIDSMMGNRVHRSISVALGAEA